MTSASPDLDAVDRPQAASLPRLNPSLALRLYATSTLHRLVPSIVATRLARFVGQRRWAQPSSREDAIAWAKAVLRGFIERGEVVMIAIDVPGSRPSTYLGRETGLASGAAELSFTTGAPVFPAFACRDGSRLRFVLEAPVYPAEVPSAAALHDLLVARAEQAVRPRLAELYPHRSALALGSAVSDRC